MAKKQPFPRKFTHCFHSPTIRCLLFQRILREKLKVPLSGRQRNDIIYKVAEQLFALYYSLLTFFRFEQHIFAKFTNCFHILSLFVAYFFLEK